MTTARPRSVRMCGAGSAGPRQDYLSHFLRAAPNTPAIPVPNRSREPGSGIGVVVLKVNVVGSHPSLRWRRWPRWGTGRVD